MRIALEDWTATGTMALASLLSCLSPSQSVQAADGAGARVYEVVAPAVLVTASRLRPCRSAAETGTTAGSSRDADCDDQSTRTARLDQRPVPQLDEKALPRSNRWRKP
jgi:hypothetical protein